MEIYVNISEEKLTPDYITEFELIIFIILKISIFQIYLFIYK